MNDEFIVSRFRWRFFSNLELGFEIDKEFENDEVVISEEIGESEIVDESIFSILSSEKSSFMNLRMKSQKYFSKFLKFFKFLDFLYDAKSHLRHEIKSTLLSFCRIKSNREKTSVFGGLDGIFSTESTTG